HDRHPRATRQGVGHEGVAVGGLPRQGEEDVAVGHGAAVEGDAIGLERRRHCNRRQRPLHLVGGPERGHEASSRATSASSKWCVTPLMVWPVSCPLPAI